MIFREACYSIRFRRGPGAVFDAGSASAAAYGADSFATCCDCDEDHALVGAGCVRKVSFPLSVFVFEGTSRVVRKRIVRDRP